MTTTMRQVLYGGVADGAEFEDAPIPRSFVAAVHFDLTDFELCGCSDSDAEPLRALYRLDPLLSEALGHWVYVPEEGGEQLQTD